MRADGHDHTDIICRGGGEMVLAICNPAKPFLHLTSVAINSANYTPKIRLDEHPGKIGLTDFLTFLALYRQVEPTQIS